MAFYNNNNQVLDCCVYLTIVLSYIRDRQWGGKETLEDTVE